MSHGAPIEACWDGEVFRPVDAYWVRRADKQFVRGEILRLSHSAERSSRSHRFYFAALKEAWKNLPALMSDRFPTEKHLRKYALIKAGYFDSRSMPCGSPALARQAQAFVKPLDEFAIVTVQGSTVWVFTAKSQDYGSMDKKTFKESADKVLDVIAAEISVAKQELIANSDRAA